MAPNPTPRVRYRLPDGAELPYVVAVLADLAGDTTQVPLPQRRPQKVGPAGVDGLLAAVRPQLTIDVASTFAERDDVELRLVLQFTALADFAPAGLARAIPALQPWLDLRARLVARLANASPRADAAAAPAAPDGADLLDAMLAASDRQSHDAARGTWSSGDMDRVAELARHDQSRGLASAPVQHDHLAALDRVLAQQVGAVLHHPRLQRLEAAWRGLDRLVAEGGDAVQVLAVPIAKDELARLAREPGPAGDHSLVRLLTAAAQPIALLVTDAEFDRGTTDVETLALLAKAAAMLQAPVLAGAAAAFLGLPDWRATAALPPFDRLFERADPRNTKWLAFRDSDAARFAALAAPAVLLRAPHAATDGTAAEPIAGAGDLLWGSGAWAVAAALLRAEVQRGWPAAACAGALPWFAPDAAHAAATTTTAADLSALAGKLAAAGLLAVTSVGANAMALPGLPSTCRPKAYQQPDATAAAALLADLRHSLVGMRLIQHLHHLHALAPGAGADDLRQRLDDWLGEFVAVDDDVDAARPLLDAAVELRAAPGERGRWRALLHVCPGLSVPAPVALPMPFELPPPRG
jgi:type VI secretion system ImpC/EvpB family protein/type VI secretion system ImpB/VipA family protein